MIEATEEAVAEEEITAAEETTETRETLEEVALLAPQDLRAEIESVADLAVILAAELLTLEEVAAAIAREESNPTQDQSPP